MFLKHFLPMVVLIGILSASTQSLAQEGRDKSSRGSVLDQLQQLQQISLPLSNADEAERTAFIESQLTRFDLAQTLVDHQNSFIRRPAIKHQFEVYRLLVQIQQGTDSASVLGQFGKFARFYSHDSDAEIAELGRRYSITVRLQVLLDGDREQAEPLQREIAAWLKNQKLTQANLQLAMQAIAGLEKSESYQLALSLLDTVSKQFADSNEKVPPQTLTAIGEARQRMSLVGQRFLVSGTLIDGQTIDSQQFAGKVVLIDFWASWCAPCRKEMPQIRKALDRYQNQGFRVVGVCLDQQRESAQRFLDQSTDVNWPILMEKKSGLAGFDHPLAKRASVAKLPTAILLDANGKVVSVAARGANLDRWLATLFHDADSVRAPFQPNDKPDDTARTTEPHID